MSDTEKKVDISNDENNTELPEESDPELEQTSISIGLNKVGEKGSGYHLLNDPSAPWQRNTVTERRGIIQVRLKSREIVHGGLSPDGENATLLVYDLQLDTAKRSRRILSAKLKFEFRSSVPGVPAPVVQGFSPAGRTSLLSSSQEETLTRGAEASAGASQFVNLTSTAKWEKTVSRTTTDSARVVGYDFCNDYGKPVGVCWDLHENPSIKSGTPSFLRCAILLNRKYDDDNFECVIKVEAEADWKSSMGQLFGSTPRDDPILFDPTLPPTNKLRKEGYDEENLGALNLDDFVEIVFDKSLKKVVDGVQ
ncbi:hypothetical protein F53441_5485 [Fusarium austroafricanum]|uniref:Uncharacterized protein n=1 Tax=Fusarium austroafricanum TaxID=2364996 RepID=A0A8H4KLR8_9HYPO|nr:hypothetical protein F53441_5485 [Fusarium austroafricanum]